MDEPTYSLRVFELISGGKPDAQSSALESAIQLGLPDALRDLANDAVAQPNVAWREHLENDYALTISSGVASFSAETDLLASSIRICDSVTHPSVVDGAAKVLPFIAKDTRLAMRLAASKPDSLFGYYFIGTSAVEVMHPTIALTTTLTVRAVKIPILSTLKTQLDNLLIAAGARRALLTMQKAASGV